MIFFVAKRYFFGRKRPLLCGGSVLLSRHELCRIYALFWSDFDADFYADIEDFVQISAQKNARWKLCLEEILDGTTFNWQKMYIYPA